MRNRLFLSFVAAASLVVASGANAGALTAATWNQTLQGVDVTVTNASTTCTNTATNVTDQVIGCPTGGLNATGVATATDFSVSLTMPLFTLSQFTTGGTIPINTNATVSGAQVVKGTANAAAGTPGVGGIVTVKTAAHTKASMYAPGMSSLLKVPLSVGKAGTFTNYFIVIGVLHYITVDFYAWTPGTQTFTGLTSKYAPLGTPGMGTVVAMGSFGLTGAGGGTVTLVSPSKISIDGALAQRRTAGFTSLKLTYAGAPEPGTLLLLGAGVAGLVLVGSRKRS
jgi:PEP-CTERM motif